MFDCTDYNKCPKYIQRPLIATDKSTLDLIFVGCWGVYCLDGDVSLIKFKWDKETSSVKKISERERYGGYTAKRMMQQYAEEYDIDAVVLAGDNVYTDYQSDTIQMGLNPTSEKEASIAKDILYNINKQLKEGYIDCYKEIPAKQFLIGIGNHDLETCNILNTQINFNDDKWTLPGLSYVQPYMLASGKKVNIIFIDTNMYTDKGSYCTDKGQPQLYSEEARSAQKAWLTDVLTKNKGSWNIVVGHIPFVFNKRKINKPNTTNSLLESLLMNLNKYIDLYCCADEHNQQFIVHKNKLPEIISGSGGAPLDLEFFEVVDGTYFYRSGYGFTGISVHDNGIQLNCVCSVASTSTYVSDNRDATKPLSYAIQWKRG